MTDDDLDQLMRRSLDVEADPQQLARLEAFWQQRVRVDRRRRRVVRIAALAAVVLVAAVVSLWPRGERRLPNSGSSIPGNQMAGQSRDAHATPHANAVDAAPRPSAARPATASRAPTAYEVMVFAATSPFGQRAQRAAAAHDVDAAIARLVDDSQADVEATAQAAGLPGRRAERLLQARLRRAASAQRRAVIALLAAGGTADSVPALLQTAERPSFRDDALAAVEAIVGVENLDVVVRRAGHPAVRVALTSRLLTAGSQPALVAHLSLVADEATRGEALAAARATSDLPIESLLRLMDAEDGAVRLAAARVLGYVDGPEVSRVLIARVSRTGRAPVEAWMALLACRGRAVDEFLGQAMHQPRLMAQVNNARAYLARTTP